MDIVDAETRSHYMSCIHGKNTKPEDMVAKYLFSQGFRYRRNVRKLPGTPDIVLRKYKTVVFVNGCFWHMHDCGSFRMPEDHYEYWYNKLTRNKQRDEEEIAKLKELGWNVLVVWECQLKKKVRQDTMDKLVEDIRKNLPIKASTQDDVRM